VARRYRRLKPSADVPMNRSAVFVERAKMKFARYSFFQVVSRVTPNESETALCDAYIAVLHILSRY